MEWMLLPLKRYAEFDGRSCRREYWMFFLLNVIVYVIAAVLVFTSFDVDVLLSVSASTDGFDQIGGLGWVGIAIGFIWILGTLIPNIAVNVRRLHDRDFSGWWYLGMIVLSNIPTVGSLIQLGYLVFCALPGTDGANRFGEDPKNPHSADVFS